MNLSFYQVQLQPSKHSWFCNGLKLLTSCVICSSSYSIIVLWKQPSPQEQMFSILRRIQPELNNQTVAAEVKKTAFDWKLNEQDVTSWKPSEWGLSWSSAQWRTRGRRQTSTAEPWNIKEEKKGYQETLKRVFLPWVICFVWTSTILGSRIRPKALTKGMKMW